MRSYGARWLASASNKANSERAGRANGMRSWSTALIVAGALLIAVLSIIGVAGAVPTSCSPCHGAQSSAWADSVHANIGCHFCHQRSGVIGVLQQRTEMLVMARSWVLSAPHERANIPDAHCLACHAGVMEGVVERNAIRVRHSDILEQGRACTHCHNTVTHGSAVGLPQRAIMDECLACHDGSRASNACDVCHVADERRSRSDIESPWQITHGVTWAYTHGLGDQNTCGSCHPAGYCSRCHGIDLPHPASWGNTHAQSALAVPASCTSCHETELCSSCHSTTMPHPDGFLPQHPTEVAETGVDACLDCHLQASCDACHEAHIHPGLTPEQIAKLGIPGGAR
jgi:hypothetical protein